MLGLGATGAFQKVQELWILKNMIPNFQQKYLVYYQKGKDIKKNMIPQSNQVAN